MGLLDVVRSAVKIADNVTKPLQAEVKFEKSTGKDRYGKVNFDRAPVYLKAIVDWKQKHVRTTSGNLTVTRASVTFLDVAALAEATVNEGVNDTDKITLPDGTTGPILDMSGFIDPGTGQPIATEVFLG